MYDLISQSKLIYFFLQYKESIPHLQKSLELNCLQISLWFNLGFACLILENWELSASAFRRYCSLEPDVCIYFSSRVIFNCSFIVYFCVFFIFQSFEAWNNLAKAYIKLGQKDRAWRALQEAVKCNYDNWKVWDNLMAVSTDCADFHEVFHISNVICRYFLRHSLKFVFSRLIGKCMFLWYINLKSSGDM